MEINLQFQNVSQTLQIVGCHFGMRPARWHYPKHHHHLYELIHCIAGAMAVDVQGERLCMEPGEWIVLKPGVNHAVANDGATDLSYFNIHFQLDDREFHRGLSGADYVKIPARTARNTKLPELVDALAQLGSGGRPFGGGIGTAAGGARTAEEGAGTAEGRASAGDGGAESDGGRSEPLGGKAQRADGDAGLFVQDGRAAPSGPVAFSLPQRIRFQAQVLLIIEEIAGLLASAETELHRPGRSVSAYEADVAHFLEEQLTWDLSAIPSITALAARLNISRSQCSRIFTKVYGISPYQYVMERKRTKAKELLATSNLTIYAIAERLGFGSVNHFSRQFRRWTGMSPSEYRRMPAHQGP
jgi:AraC-like DNA-binding protein/uncharacterized cupin superfamily protein